MTVRRHYTNLKYRCSTHTHTRMRAQSVSHTCVQDFIIHCSIFFGMGSSLTPLRSRHWWVTIPWVDAQYPTNSFVRIIGSTFCIAVYTARYESITIGYQFKHPQQASKIVASYDQDQVFTSLLPVKLHKLHTIADISHDWKFVVGELVDHDDVVFIRETPKDDYNLVSDLAAFRQYQQEIKALRELAEPTRKRIRTYVDSEMDL